jgi:hypothetical protein
MAWFDLYLQLFCMCVFFFVFFLLGRGRHVFVKSCHWIFLIIFLCTLLLLSWPCSNCFINTFRPVQNLFHLYIISGRHRNDRWSSIITVHYLFQQDYSSIIQWNQIISLYWWISRKSSTCHFCASLKLYKDGISFEQANLSWQRQNIITSHSYI